MALALEAVPKSVTQIFADFAPLAIICSNPETNPLSMYCGAPPFTRVVIFDAVKALKPPAVASVQGEMSVAARRNASTPWLDPSVSATILQPTTKSITVETIDIQEITTLFMFNSLKKCFFLNYIFVIIFDKSVQL
jgi:hypothetical protein